jgi:hypothetical protein
MLDVCLALDDEAGAFGLFFGVVEVAIIPSFSYALLL